MIFQTIKRFDTTQDGRGNKKAERDRSSTLML